MRGGIRESDMGELGRLQITNATLGKLQWVELLNGFIEVIFVTFRFIVVETIPTVEQGIGSDIFIRMSYFGPTMNRIFSFERQVTQFGSTNLLLIIHPQDENGNFLDLLDGYKKRPLKEKY